MESGEVPPPRKATARSLTTPQPPRPPQQAQQYPSNGMIPAGPGSVNHAAPMPGAQFIRRSAHEPGRAGPGQAYQPAPYYNGGLEPRSSSLSYTVSAHGDNEHLRALLKEEISKSQSMAHQHSICEEELASEKSKNASLSMELQGLKQKKLTADNDLAQSTADYMNAQAKLMEQIDNLNSEVQTLKTKLTQSTEQSTTLSAENVELLEKVQSAETARQKEIEKRMRPDNVQTNATDLERRQNKLLIEELKSCHNRFKAEIEELKGVKERLIEENENLQMVLVERTVSGELPSSETNANSGDDKSGGTTGDGLGQTLADEELMEFPEEIPEDDNVANKGEQLDAIDSLKKIINQQKFDIRSLQNHNRALTKSLESLVDRMLNNRVFADAVEAAVSKPTISQFRSRVASYNVSDLAGLNNGVTVVKNSPSLDNNGPYVSPSTAYTTPRKTSRSVSRNGKVNSPQVWSKMIINSQYTGNPNRRAFSLGIDNDEIRTPTNPEENQRHTSEEGELPSRLFRKRN